jgi:tetratricopeptide (TPR) repeat protein
MPAPWHKPDERCERCYLTTISNTFLDLTPEDAVNDLAVAHNRLGSIYGQIGDVDTALGHFQKALQYKEQSGDRYHAGQTRGNIALALADAGRFGDALVYAQAALRDYEHIGAAAADMLDQTKQLIADIEQHLAATEASR